MYGRKFGNNDCGRLHSHCDCELPQRVSRWGDHGDNRKCELIIKCRRIHRIQRIAVERARLIVSPQFFLENVF